MKLNRRVGHFRRGGDGDGNVQSAMVMVSDEDLGAELKRHFTSDF